MVAILLHWSMAEMHSIQAGTRGQHLSSFKMQHHIHTQDFLGVSGRFLSCFFYDESKQA